MFINYYSIIKKRDFSRGSVTLQCMSMDLTPETQAARKAVTGIPNRGEETVGLRLFSR